MSQNVRCIAGAFGTVITQVYFTPGNYVNVYKSQKVYTITTFQWVMYMYTYNIFVTIIDKNNRHFSGCDQISFIGDDGPTRK